MKIRKAKREDGAALAYLTNLAGEGLAAYLWGQAAPPGITAMEYGAQKVAGETGNFSYRNAHVAENDQGEVTGMLLSMRQPDPYNLPDFSQLPPFVRPLVELEALAPGSYYVNVVGVFEKFHGQGIGTELMAKAEELARDCGADCLSLIVASENSKARRLYEYLGYSAGKTLPVVPYEGMLNGGNWILMTKRM